MQVIKQLTQWQQIRNTLNQQSIGFVATMGNLHCGHESLLKRSIHENDITVLSIYVNPTQFNNPDDFDKYPNTLDDDIAIAKQAGVDYLLLPSYEEMYPDNFHYQVHETDLSQYMEGKHRPGHFTGMLTIVLKLLMIVSADRAYFGEKDYQQWQLIEKMRQAFFLNTEIIPCPIIRDEQGLAYSSRNNRFNAQQLEHARKFPAILAKPLPAEEVATLLADAGFDVDYVEEHDGRRYAAVYLGDVRLIDNISMTTIGAIAKESEYDTVS